MAHSLKQGQFAVTFEPEPDAVAGERQWVELLANGLTFDLSGVAPGPSERAEQACHFYGFDSRPDLAQFEVMRLVPGPHLTSGGPMIPVIRCLAWLAAELATLDGIQGLIWKPARAVSSPAHFREGVTRWIGGGAFPGLGLTALVPQDDGTMTSEGLALFTGQELVIDRAIAEDRAGAAKLAVRLLHWLVETGRIDRTQSLTGPSGETLMLEPDHHAGVVRVWRGSR
ncbi:hypothetical protein [Alteraurantiacibacter buctensis]|uniref:DUF4261 domain-containing protein n=1 Tax=Alteraurantiacibacter buctensis TaxID=1503981 RepID=A0A844YVW5_9SPHN|nr:hypothetical protein [Alteraurantiacibacter buctensis]MXO71679.1 hypothetical protein [Alteraurantiacibacter buctensis]